DYEWCRVHNSVNQPLSVRRPDRMSNGPRSVSEPVEAATIRPNGPDIKFPTLIGVEGNELAIRGPCRPAMGVAVVRQLAQGAAIVAGDEKVILLSEVREDDPLAVRRRLNVAGTSRSLCYRFGPPHRDLPRRIEFHAIDVRRRGALNVGHLLS